MDISRLPNCSTAPHYLSVTASMNFDLNWFHVSPLSDQPELKSNQL